MEFPETPEISASRTNGRISSWICVRCGMQYSLTDRPPAACLICEDEREAVAAGGQEWTDANGLAQHHTSEPREEEPGLLGVGLTPEFGIGQRALLVQTEFGNVL